MGLLGPWSPFDLRWSLFDLSWSSFGLFRGFISLSWSSFDLSLSSCGSSLSFSELFWSSSTLYCPPPGEQASLLRSDWSLYFCGLSWQSSVRSWSPFELSLSFRCCSGSSLGLSWQLAVCSGMFIDRLCIFVIRSSSADVLLRSFSDTLPEGTVGTT